MYAISQTIIFNHGSSDDTADFHESVGLVQDYFHSAWKRLGHLFWRMHVLPMSCQTCNACILADTCINGDGKQNSPPRYAAHVCN